MGLNSTGDEYCRRGNIAIQDLEGVEKVVDDMLVHSSTMEEHVQHVKAVLERCRKHGITLNRDKFKLASEEVSFVGYLVSSHGIAADPGKVQAIRDFPQPANVTDLRSFLGLVNQLGAFSKDISGFAEPLRPLLKSKNVFMWLPEHVDAFNQLKTSLSSPPILQP